MLSYVVGCVVANVRRGPPASILAFREKEAKSCDVLLRVYR